MRLRPDLFVIACTMIGNMLFLVDFRDCVVLFGLPLQRTGQLVPASCEIVPVLPFGVVEVALSSAFLRGTFPFAVRVVGLTRKKNQQSTFSSQAQLNLFRLTAATATFFLPPRALRCLLRPHLTPDPSRRLRPRILISATRAT